MAGKDVQKLYCWSIISGKLFINLASTGKGAAMVGLELGGKENCLEYYERLFPDYQVTVDEALNRPLDDAVRKALRGKKIPGNLPLDICCTDFQREAWKTIAWIPFGQTRTYGEVASMMGRPGGARAVGQAMNRNPLPLIFP